MKRASPSEPSDQPNKTESVECAFCHKTFKKSGLSQHHNFCRDKPVLPPTGRRSYSFYLFNEQLFEHILGFLGNQTLTKLQVITGDRYYQCQRELARLCCPCENDNPVMVAGLCLQCEKNKSPLFQVRVTMQNAKDLYDITKFTGIPRHGVAALWSDDKAFERADLEQHLVDRYGSKLKWLKAIARKDKKDFQLRMSVARRIQRKAEYNAVVDSLSQECISYVKALSWRNSSECDVVALKSKAVRYLAVTTALEGRGLRLNQCDRDFCYDYIIIGLGCVEDAVNETEELQFLHDHTSYKSRCERRISQLRKTYAYDSDESDDSEDSYYDSVYGYGGKKKKECRENAKEELCVEYLGESRGLTLPQKWQACRQRYEYTRSVGADPTRCRHYIYTGEGELPKT